MDRQEAQRKIDAVPWYHEFDFGGGLRTLPQPPDLNMHRKCWAFIENHLDRIDFRNRTVLDVGCWDGYWSFYAERRLARRVLALDDASQNWAGSRGFTVARELFGSSVDVNLNFSVYDLASLGQKFDIILFLGVYYHLHDPFYALAQLRHCCHHGTVLAIEGDARLGRHSGSLAIIDNSDHAKAKFSPSRGALNQLLQAAYFTPTLQDDLSLEEHPRGRLGWRWRLKMCIASLRGSRASVLDQSAIIDPILKGSNGRLFMTCRPFEGTNPAHHYSPPFGLHVYDDRFREKAAA